MAPSGLIVQTAPMHFKVRRTALLGAALFAMACSNDEPEESKYTRGRGLKVATLSPAADARIIEGAIHASFDVEPSLLLLMEPHKLPRTPGVVGGDSVPSEVVRLLRDRGLVRGTCVPRREAPRDTPRCAGTVPGYVIQTSDVLRVAADTVLIYFAAETFGPATGLKPQALRFEKLFELVGSGTEWRVVREARAKE